MYRSRRVFLRRCNGELLKVTALLTYFLPESHEKYAAILPHLYRDLTSPGYIEDDVF